MAMRLLLIEDEPKLARAIAKGLRQEAFAVDVAEDGPTGLAFATTEEYDLIILDRMLPGVEDGLDICKTLREKGYSTPVLVLTARDTVPDRVTGLNAGADDYLIKPFAFDELVARLHALLRRPVAVQDTVIEVADLSLNPQTHEVKRSGTPIELTQREFALLEYLMRNANRPVSKDQIMAHVWEYESDILPNTVEAFIVYLRNKVERPFKGQKLIHTVRGFGYRLASGE